MVGAYGCRCRLCDFLYIVYVVSNFFFLVLSLLSTGSHHAGVQGSVCLGFCHSSEALSVDMSESTSGSLIELRPLR